MANTQKRNVQKGPQNKMSLGDFYRVAQCFTPDQAILLRGESGIGKTEIVKTLAEHFRIPCIDVPLPLMNEGDLCFPVLKDREGKPIKGKTDEEKVEKYLEFISSESIQRACQEPCLIFFDELNRAIPAVMNYAFRVGLAREMNHLKLHPDTRVVAAINLGSNYSAVNDMDSALKRRFWVADLEANVVEWRKWASSRKDEIPSFLIDFLRAHPEHFKEHPDVESDHGIYTDPRKYHFLGRQIMNGINIKGATYYVDATGIIVHPENENTFLQMCIGLIGKEAAQVLAGHIDKYQKVSDPNFVLKDLRQNLNKNGFFKTSGISWEEIIKRNKDKSYDSKKNFGLVHDISNIVANDEILNLNEILVNHFKSTGRIAKTNKERENLAIYIKLLPLEHAKTFRTNILKFVQDASSGNDNLEQSRDPLMDYNKLNKEFLKGYMVNLIDVVQKNG